MGKTSKRKGPRRAYMKRFSSAMVNSGTGPSPNREVLADLHHRAARMGEHFVDRVPRHIYVTDDQRLEALWQSDFRQGLDSFNKISLTHGVYGRVHLHFRGDRWVFVPTDVSLGDRSVVYSARHRAMQAYNLSRIVWVKHTSPPG
jgi:hypothetical protein